ncbi:hypothetical protein BC827DRAFT_129533 [Russula dissimulans]|nr:hypothetical protein BC827DRAFT_129533 [Russula dissimulans]
MNDSSSSTRFKSLFDAALLDYEKQTGTTLAGHPLAKQLETCESVESITAFFQEQVSSFRDVRDGGKIMNSLKSAVPVLHSLSTNSILRNCISVPFPPATAIFAGLAVLLAAIKGVNASFDALVNLLECIGKFLNRLDIYVKIPPTPAMTEVVVEIIVELISALALETKK